MEELQPNKEVSPPQQHELSTDERAIELGIHAARAEDREVDDATARRIASQLHGGQDSALYSLASTGNLADERLETELGELYRSRNARILEWANVLGTYALHRENKGPVDGWSELTADDQSAERALGATALDGSEANAVEGERRPPPPQIWVGSLSDYNAGRLHGEWINADQEPEDLHAAVQQMLERSPMVSAEEWAIMDYDGFYGLRLGEYASRGIVNRCGRRV